MKKLILLITLFCTAEFSFSQADYRKGYVITNANDTLFGLVDYRTNANAYKSCDYKASEDQNTITYEPGSIIAYGFENDKFYQSKEISIKNKPSQVIFLEVIVKGLVSLYEFEDIFFVEKGNDGLHQLINETKEIIVKEKTLIRNSNQHIATLNMLVFDCAEIRTKIPKTKLNERSLTNLIELYNRCQGGSSVTFKGKKPWTKIVIGLNGGLNVSQLNFNKTPGYGHLAGHLKLSKSPMIGASFDLSSPRLNDRISFHGDLLYLTSKYYNYTSHSPPVERNYVTIKLQELKTPFGIRYTFPKRKFTPYLNAGMSITIHLSSNSKWVHEIESSSVVYTDESEALTIKNNQFGLWGGCGVLTSINNKLNASFEFRYDRTNGIAPFAIHSGGLESKVSNFQILIGIRTK